MPEEKKTPKEHKIVSASTGKVTASADVRSEQAAAAARPVKQAAPVGNAGPLRIGAAVLWAAAILFEVLGVLILQGKVTFKVMPTLYQFIVVIVLDLACVIIGAQLWKKANHIDPASEANKTKFWLWNNMGVIVCIVAFVPFIILLLTNKNIDGKTKKIAAIVAIFALLIGGVSSYDFSPVSAEQKTAAVQTLGDTQVYWAPFGKVYHTHEDCQALNQTDTLTAGTVDEAIAAGRTRLCSFCAKRDNITGVVTDTGEALTESEVASGASLAPAA